VFEIFGLDKDWTNGWMDGLTEIIYKILNLLRKVLSFVIL